MHIICMDDERFSAVVSSPLNLNIFSLSVRLTAFSPNSYFYPSLFKFPPLQPFPSLFPPLRCPLLEKRCPFFLCGTRCAGISLVLSTDSSDEGGFQLSPLPGKSS